MPTINFIFSTADSLTGIVTPVHLGTVQNTGSTSDLGVYLKHDHTADLTNCSFYIQPYLGTGYVGRNGESPDYNEVLAWGTWSNTRGLMINQDASDTTTDFDVAFSTATGNVSTRAMPLSTLAFTDGLSTEAGQFPVADTAHFTLRLCPPVEATNAGLRQFSLVMNYEV